MKAKSLSIEQGLVIAGLIALLFIPSVLLLIGILGIQVDILYQRYLNHKERNFKFLEWEQTEQRLNALETNGVRLQGSVDKSNEGIASVNAALSMLRR